MDEERIASLRELEDRLGYSFREMELLDKAFIHKSFIHETNNPEKVANEVLEFLGDAVLSLAVSHLLLLKFPDAQEGTLSMIRAHLVKRGSLVLLSRELQLEKYLLLGKSQQLNEGIGKSSILADAYEALIGAIYMDSGFIGALEIVQQHFQPHLQAETSSEMFEDFKSLLQIYSQQSLKLSPQYRLLNESGPGHDKRFQASVTIDGTVRGIGWGKSKKEAEQEAARNALKEITTQLQIQNPK